MTRNKQHGSVRIGSDATELDEAAGMRFGR
jgi:hypothetical protein